MATIPVLAVRSHNFSDEWKKRVARLTGHPGPYNVTHDPKKYVLVKGMVPVAFNLTYRDAYILKRAQLARSHQLEQSPIFDIAVMEPLKETTDEQ